MKILFVSSGNKEGGADILIRAQGASLSARGLEICYFSILGRGLTGYLGNIRKLSNYLVRNNFEIIHAHYGLSVVISCLSARKEKVIASFMGDDLIGSTDAQGAYTRLSRLLSLVSKFFARYGTSFNIVKSHNLARTLWHKTCYEIIPNGVNFKVFFPVQKRDARDLLGLAHEDKIVLFPADPTRPEKNFDLAKKACDQFSLQLILLPVYMVEQEKLNLFYNAADVVLLTSFHEGSPNVIKEAMACNRPIVSTRVGDVEENIGGTEGCFLSGFTPEDVCNCLDKALKFERTEGRERISHLESTVIAARLEAIYRKVLHK